MLHRPYIRQEVRQEVEQRAQKNDKGQFLDANTHKPIEGKYDLGHKPGHEHWREAEKAEKEGLTQKQFNERMNNPDLYQIESPHENRSHAHEMPVDAQVKNNKLQTKTQSNEGGKSPMEKNGFMESIKADKATIDRCNQVSRNAAKNANTQSGKKDGIDNGGRERGDSGPLSQGREAGNKGGTPTAHNSANGDHTSSGQGISSGHSSAGQSSGGSHGTGGQGSGGQGSGGQGSGGHGGH